MEPLCPLSFLSFNHLNLASPFKSLKSFFSFSPLNEESPSLKDRVKVQTPENRSFASGTYLKLTNNTLELGQMTLIAKIFYRVFGLFLNSSVHEFCRQETEDNLNYLMTYPGFKMSREVLGFLSEENLEIPLNFKKIFDSFPNETEHLWDLLIIDSKVNHLNELSLENFESLDLDHLKLYLSGQTIPKRQLTQILSLFEAGRNKIYFDNDRSYFKNLTRVLLESLPKDDPELILSLIKAHHSFIDLEGEDLISIANIFSSPEILPQLSEYADRLIDNKYRVIDALAFAGKNEAIDSLKDHPSYSDVNLAGTTFLHFAAAGGNFALYDKMTKEEKWESSEDQLGQNCLIYATRFGSLETIQSLVQRGFTLDSKDIQGSNLAFFAIARNDLQITEWLFAQDPHLFLKRNADNMTPLLKAASKGSVECMEFILEKDLENIRSIQPYLEIAAAHGQIGYFRQLESMIENKSIPACMRSAASNGQKEMLNYFESNGFAIDEELLYFAAMQPDSDFLNWLIVDKKISPKNRPDVLMAIFQNHPDVAISHLKILLNAGVNVDESITNPTLLERLQLDDKLDMIKAIAPYLFGTETVSKFVNQQDKMQLIFPTIKLQTFFFFFGDNFSQFLDGKESIWKKIPIEDQVYLSLMIDSKNVYKTLFEQYSLESVTERVKDLFPDQKLSEQLCEQLGFQHSLLGARIGKLEVVDELSKIPEPTFSIEDTKKLIRQFLRNATTTDKKSPYFISVSTLRNLGLNNPTIPELKLWSDVLIRRLETHEFYLGVPADFNERRAWYLNLEKLIFNISSEVAKMPPIEQTPLLTEIICTAINCGGTIAQVHQLYQLVCIKKVDKSSDTFLTESLKRIAMKTRIEFFESFLKRKNQNDVHVYNHVLNEVADAIGIPKSYTNDMYGDVVLARDLAKECKKEFLQKYPLLLMRNTFREIKESEELREVLEQTTFENLPEEIKAVFNQNIEPISQEDIEQIDQILPLLKTEDLQLYIDFQSQLQVLNEWIKKLPNEQKSLKLLNASKSFDEEMVKDLEGKRYPEIDALKTFLQNLPKIKEVGSQIDNLRMFLPINNLSKKLIELSQLPLIARRNKLIEIALEPELKHNFLADFYLKSHVVHYKYVMQSLIDAELLLK